MAPLTKKSTPEPKLGIWAPASTCGSTLLDVPELERVIRELANDIRLEPHKRVGLLGANAEPRHADVALQYQLRARLHLR